MLFFKLLLILIFVIFNFFKSAINMYLLIPVIKLSTKLLVIFFSSVIQYKIDMSRDLKLLVGDDFSEDLISKIFCNR